MPPTLDAEQLPIDSLCATSSYVSLQSLFGSEDFSDMTIRCRGREFKTHRAIVCSQSSFFKKALSSNFKEGVSGTIDLPDDDPKIVKLFLEFLYTGTYSDEDADENEAPNAVKDTNEHILTRLKCAPGSDGYIVATRADFAGGSRTATPNSQKTGRFRWSPYVFKPSAAWGKGKKTRGKLPKLQDAIRIYVMADKFDVPALRLLARERFFEAGKDILLCTETWIGSKWDETAWFNSMVGKIYRSTSSEDDPLRKALQKLISMKTEDDMMSKRMREVMKLNGELAVGVMDYLREDKKVDEPCLQCGYQDHD
ncbi:hypothetical protein CEP53_010764 [Fusarium sp. AF-6]|nr:hypothetical protein CEP53_010764 [Fusarium sp. AF-6]